VPISRPDVADLAAELAESYRGLQEELAAGLSRRLARGIESDDWTRRKMDELGQVRRDVEKLVQRTTKRMPAKARKAVEAAFQRGGAAALAEVGARNARALPGAGAINRLSTALTGRLGGVQLQIVRSTIDAYQRTVAAGSVNVLGGALTRRQASERVWNQLLDRGLATFTDVRGRTWDAAGYAEMAVRSTTAQAAVAGHLERLEDLGIDLVIVSNAAQECEKCRPWEGKILARSGPDGARTIQVEHATQDGVMVEVRIAGTVAEAIRAGLMHPNCRHSINAYLPGLTRVPTRTADPEGDKARQRLRALERQVRTAKLREAGALTPEAKTAAAGRARAAQAKIREHVKANPTLTRRNDREQLQLSNRRSETPVTPAASMRAEADRMRADLAAGVRETRQLGGGAMARVDRLTTESGRSVVRKQSHGWTGRPPEVEQDAEELGALVVRAVGGRAPAVLREGPDTVAMPFVDGSVWLELPEGAARVAARSTDDARAIGLSDVLMGNVDRNAGNAIVGPGGEVYAIDHGSAFDWHPEFNPPGAPAPVNNLFSEFFVADSAFIPGSLRAGEADAIRAQLAALRPEFERLGHLDWYENMLSRLAALEGA
jgi:hypothetical protein